MPMAMVMNDVHDAVIELEHLFGESRLVIIVAGGDEPPQAAAGAGATAAGLRARVEGMAAQSEPRTRCIVIRDDRMVRHTAAAIRLTEGSPGGRDASGGAGREVGIEAHATFRWAWAVVRAIDAPRDPKNLTQWGRSVGVSYGGLRNWCSTARISSKSSLAFARILRALLQRNVRPGTPAEELLDVVDRRTLRKLLKLGEPTRPESETLPADVETFLSTQAWVRNANALGHIQRLLQERHARA